MPEVRFLIKWSDGSQSVCYSPSSVIKKYFTPNTDYDLDDFVMRSRTALTIASDRVAVKYGFPCRKALGQLAAIEAKSINFKGFLAAKVRFIQFIE
jgi:uncharacterized repeat protein (TIGR04042 family)